MLTPASSVKDGDEVSVLTEGFLDDPFYVWIAPDVSTRFELLTTLFTLELCAAARQGFLFSDERGVVVLVPPDGKLLDHDESAEVTRLMRNALDRPPEVLDDYGRRLDEASRDIAGAWYLQYIAVPSEERSRGHGSSLMCDIVGEVGHTSLWLHTGRPRTLRFYARWGLVEVAVTLCEPAGPAIYTVLRAGR